MTERLPVLFFFPTRFHLFDQLVTKAFAGESFRIYSIYPPRYFRDGRFAALRHHNRTLWLGLLLYGVMRLATRAGVAANAVRGLRRLFITGCALEFRLRTVFATPSLVVAAAGYLGYGVAALQRAGHVVAVNHGSLYEQREREIMLAISGVAVHEAAANWSDSWLIARMDREFSVAERIMVCSTTARDSFPATLQPQIVVVPLGAQLDGDGSASVHQRSGGGVVFLHISSLVQRKNVGAILDAFMQIKGDDDRLVVGGPVPSDAVLRNRLQHAAAGIVWLGRLDRDGVRHAMREANIFVHPSFADGWGMVVSEALAAGLPVVASAQTGAAVFYAEHSALGASSIELANPYDSEDIARAMAAMRAKVMAVPHFAVVQPLSWEHSAEILKGAMAELSRVAGHS